MRPLDPIDLRRRADPDPLESGVAHQPLDLAHIALLGQRESRADVRRVDVVAGSVAR